MNLTGTVKFLSSAHLSVASLLLVFRGQPHDVFSFFFISVITHMHNVTVFYLTFIIRPECILLVLIWIRMISSLCLNKIYSVINRFIYIVCLFMKFNFKPSLIIFKTISETPYQVFLPCDRVSSFDQFCMPLKNIIVLVLQHTPPLSRQAFVLAD